MATELVADLASHLATDEEGNDMAPVVSVTREELEGRRAALLAELGTSLEDFERLAATRTLTGREFDVKEELDEIAFLLGE
jgi:hypothetical protein